MMTGVSEFTTKSVTSKIDHEIARYRKEIPNQLNDSATDWWRKKSSQYPLLRKLAQCYLAFPGTSSPRMRVFFNTRRRSHSTEDHPQLCGYVGLSEQKPRTVVLEVIFDYGIFVF